MTIAKYAYLMDKIYGVPTHYDYKRWHLGPYPTEIKKAINNKKFFKVSAGDIQLADDETLFKYNNPYSNAISEAVDGLTTIFSKYSDKDKPRKTELLATICKVIEDIQTVDLDKVRESMADWKIDLKTTNSKSKAEKFSEEETRKCLEFIIEMGWHEKLLQ